MRYLTKYLTMGIADTYADTDRPDPRYEAHIDRLHEILAVLPCSPECGNWLRYGVQPRNAGPGADSRLVFFAGTGPGEPRLRRPTGPGLSRAWSGKTLREHRADRAAVVRAVLAEAGIDAPDTDRLATSVLADDGLPRFTWEEMPASEADYVQVGMGSVLQAQRWRRQYDDARTAQSRASPDAA